MKDQYSLSDVLKIISGMGNTQTEIAKQLGVSGAYLSEIMGGTRKPGPKLLEALKMRSETFYFHK